MVDIRSYLYVLSHTLLVLNIDLAPAVGAAVTVHWNAIGFPVLIVAFISYLSEVRNIISQ